MSDCANALKGSSWHSIVSVMSHANSRNRFFIKDLLHFNKPAEPERTKALKIVVDEFIQLLHGVVNGDEVVEHRAGGGKNTSHIVEDLADFFDVGQHIAETVIGRRGTADNGLCLIEREQATING